MKPNNFFKLLPILLLSPISYAEQSSPVTEPYSEKMFIDLVKLYKQDLDALQTVSIQYMLDNAEKSEMVK